MWERTLQWIQDGSQCTAISIVHEVSGLEQVDAVSTSVLSPAKCSPRHDSYPCSSPRPLAVGLRLKDLQGVRLMLVNVGLAPSGPPPRARRRPMPVLQVNRVPVWHIDPCPRQMDPLP